MCPLPFVPSSGQVRVKTIEGGRRLKHKLYTMGITEDSVFEIIRHSDRGGIIIKKDNFKIAIGFGMANKIIVDII